MVTGCSVEGNQSSGIVNGGKVGQFGSINIYLIYVHILVPITMIDISSPELTQALLN